MNYADSLKEILKAYKKEEIIITNHAKEQALFRDISLDEIKANIINPFRLSFARKQLANNENEKKYDCYFEYSRTQCHRYVLIVTTACIVCTVIKINRRWQYIIEKNAKI